MSGQRVMDSPYMHWAKTYQTARYTLALSGIKSLTLAELGASLDDVVLNSGPGYGLPELKLALGGKGVLKEASRRLLPAAVIDRTKGHFPVPAIIELEGEYLQRVRDALQAPEARARGLFRREYVDALLADPNAHRTRLGSNQLWQVGLLELWLQQHGIR